MAFLMARMAEIWLPRWKWISSKQLSMSASRRKRTASTTSRVERPNLDRSPPDASQRPEPLEASFTRIPMRGLTPILFAVDAMRSSSENFSTTMSTLRPSFEHMSAVSMYSSSL